MRLLCLIAFMMFMAAPYAQAVDTCAPETIAAQVQDQFNSAVPDAKHALILKQVRMGITKGLVIGEKKDEALAALLEYDLRLAQQCSIPDDLKLRTAKTLKITGDNEKICDTGQFSKIVERQHRSLATSPGYPAFEAIIQSQVSSNITSPMRESFNALWASDSKFRARVIKAGLEINTMNMNGCANLQDPIMPLIDYIY